MQSLNLDFLRGVTSVGTGPVFRNDRYSLAVVQIDVERTGEDSPGSFRIIELDMILEGRTDEDGEWVEIQGWSVGNPSQPIPPPGDFIVTPDSGIYEYPIEHVVEFRFRVRNANFVRVSAVGVLYDAGEGTVYPYPPVGQTVTFGDPRLFVKGEAEQIFFDPVTGNIIGYDKTATEGSVSITANLSEITGGMGNQLIGVLPDTARISGTYTSAAFSLETRERIMGGDIAFNAVAQTCETVAADGETLVVSGTPAPALGESKADETYWCYVKHVGSAADKGTNALIDPDTRAVRNYAAERGERYEVTYFTHRISAQTLPIPSTWNPVMMTVQQRYGVYARQNGSAEKGILRGWLYFIVPRAILNADAGVSATQGSTAATSGNWIALPERPENMPLCDCSDTAHPLAYYVYVPCGGANDAVEDIISVGSGMSVRTGRSKQLPIKLVMPDDTLIQPDFYSLNYYSEDDGTATVDAGGIVTGVDEGETVVHAYLTKTHGEVLDCATAVSVIGAASALTSNPDHILIG